MAKGGKLRLLTRKKYPDDWQPDNDSRTPHWKLTQHLIKTLLNKGETGAAQLLSKVGDEAETARSAVSLV